MAFAPNIWVLLLARVIDGSTAGNISLAQAYISDITVPEARAKSFGVIGIAFGIGFLIGPAISGFLVRYGYRTPIFAAAALSALSILATLCSCLARNRISTLPPSVLAANASRFSNGPSMPISSAAQCSRHCWLSSSASRSALRSSLAASHYFSSAVSPGKENRSARAGRLHLGLRRIARESFCKVRCSAAW
jgi:MFS family permease